MKVISLYAHLTFYTFLCINEIKCAAIICDEITKASSSSSPSTPTTMVVAASSASQQSNNREIHVNQTLDGGVVIVNKGVKKLLHSIQCTLEKAKPWVDELEHEAKRLEQAAKRLGLGILHTFGEFMEKLMGDIRETVITTTTTKTTTTTAAAAASIVSGTTGNNIFYNMDTLHNNNDKEIEATAAATAATMTTNNFMTMADDRKLDSKSTTSPLTKAPTKVTTRTANNLRPIIINRNSSMDSPDGPSTIPATLTASATMAFDHNDENEIFNLI